VTRAHLLSVTRRRGQWELLESPELDPELEQANREIRRLKGAFDLMSKPFPGHKSLTPRERMALAHIVRGASAKEVGRSLGISPRTAEFHRANILQKLGAKNTIDLVRKVLGEIPHFVSAPALRSAR
jgi:DNA-binding CsgD family transcriptional regulator